MSLIYSKYLSMNRRLIILSQANIETHSRMRSSMILKDSVFRKEQRTHTISPERPTFLSLPCNPPQNQHCRINRMKARARFRFQSHIRSFRNITYCRSRSISLNISPNIPKTEKPHGILDSHRTGNRQEESVILISCGKNSCFSDRSRKAALRAGCS